MGAQFGDHLVVHELAHQWFGNHVGLSQWRDVWLSEGFATYVNWWYSGNQGSTTPQQFFDDIYRSTPASDPFWQLVVADPGPDNLFHDAIYDRGAMTLQALRNEVGDRTFLLHPPVLAPGVRRGHGVDRGLHCPRRDDLPKRPEPALRRLALHTDQAGRGRRRQLDRRRRRPDHR